MTLELSLCRDRYAKRILIIFKHASLRYGAPGVAEYSQEMRGFCKVRSENHRTILFMKSFLFSLSEFKVRNVEFLPNILLVKSFFFQSLQIVEIRINFSFILIVSKATKTYVLLSVNCTLSHYELWQLQAFYWSQIAFSALTNESDEL